MPDPVKTVEVTQFNIRLVTADATGITIAIASDVELHFGNVAEVAALSDLLKHGVTLYLRSKNMIP